MDAVYNIVRVITYIWVFFFFSSDIYNLLLDFPKENWANIIERVCNFVSNVWSLIRVEERIRNFINSPIHLP